jgi:hypothetical protein
MWERMKVEGVEKDEGGRMGDEGANVEGVLGT